MISSIAPGPSAAGAADESAAPTVAGKANTEFHAIPPAIKAVSER
jgi:hypothetical protein